MNYDALEKLLFSHNGAARDFPFGPEVAVYKVAGKMFALVAGEDELRISLKCDPLEADFLRSMYDAVKPGYHLNKSHWNTITLDGSVPEGLLRKMIDSSYALVVKGLLKAEREQLT
ncbi:MAG: MmcQ/YjbR family DNA-binding protein [Desulfuromonadaceae bacterium]|nr:MmcQ/YjbR family DNA-binding protein [Desulfuromonadaceae bacterium]